MSALWQTLQLNIQFTNRGSVLYTDTYKYRCITFPGNGLILPEILNAEVKLFGYHPVAKRCITHNEN